MASLIITLAFLVTATTACLYYVVLTVFGYRRALRPRSGADHRFAVLIPAHNEELSLPASLRSILHADYPRDRVEVYVVADNCTDRTADVAQACGVGVLERSHASERGKGYALRHGLDAILPTRPDAVLILDADCQVEATLFRVLDAHLSEGADTVQVAVATRNADDGPTGYIGAIGNAFDNRLSAGKDRLGWTVPLRGSGMAFRRDVLERFPWTEFGLTEDADYTERLRRGGVRVRFDSAPLVRSETPARRGDLYQQRRRWRAALFSGPGFPVQWLESKPFVLFQLVATGLIVALFQPGFAVWYGVLVALTMLVYARIIATVGVTRRRLAFLPAAPGIVAKLALVTLGGFRRRNLAWERTRRAAESVAPARI